MDRMPKYRIFVIALFFVLLVLGVYIGFQVSGSGEDNEQIKENIAKNNEEDKVDIYTAPVSTKTYDIEVIYEDHYTLCNETITKKDTVYGTTLEKLKVEEKAKQVKDDAEYKVSEESNEKLIYTRTIDQNCPNHFMVKLEDGIVNIYNVVNDTLSTVYQKIDIPQELIRTELLEELNNGIKVDTKEELNLLIEDLES